MSETRKQALSPIANCELEVDLHTIVGPGGAVAECAVGDWMDFAEENARELVHRWNSYPALVAELTKLRAFRDAAVKALNSIEFVGGYTVGPGSAVRNEAIVDHALVAAAVAIAKEDCA